MDLYLSAAASLQPIQAWSVQLLGRGVDESALAEQTYNFAFHSAWICAKTHALRGVSYGWRTAWSVTGLRLPETRRSYSRSSSRPAVRSRSRRLCAGTR